MKMLIEHLGNVEKVQKPFNNQNTFMKTINMNEVRGGSR